MINDLLLYRDLYRGNGSEIEVLQGTEKESPLLRWRDLTTLKRTKTAPWQCAIWRKDIFASGVMVERLTLDVLAKFCYY